MVWCSRRCTQFIGRTVQLEQRNQAMNYFIGVLVEKMREAGIYTVLVKGQGVGQCYERPLWRSCGDVDLFFDAENYERAKGSSRRWRWRWSRRGSARSIYR